MSAALLMFLTASSLWDRSHSVPSHQAGEVAPESSLSGEMEPPLKAQNVTLRRWQCHVDSFLLLHCVGKIQTLFYCSEKYK